MESDLWFSIVGTVVLGTFVFVFGFLKKINQWYYVSRVGERQDFLPPGDMGWPVIGNMLSFVKAFRSQDPDSFIDDLIKRYGRRGIYKTHLFWKPTILVCNPEWCKRVLTDNDTFPVGYPPSANRLAGKASLEHVSNLEHRNLRKLTAPSISGQEALSMYVGYIEEIVITTLEKWAAMNKPIEVVKEMKKLTFKIIATIFFGSISDFTVESMWKVYPNYGRGFGYALIGIPGSLNRALKAKAELKKILRAELEELKTNKPNSRRGMAHLLMEVKDSQGEKLEDDYILDLLLMYLFAGHESPAYSMVSLIVNLHNNTDKLQEAKEEQEAIIKRRPSSQKGLTLLEIKEMKYMKKVIDETLRIASSLFAKFRQTRTDVSINGYVIPKGWSVLVWSRAVHLDPEIYPNPKEFLPSRCDEHIPKVGAYFPFSAGNMICPGADLSQIQMSIFLHYFILHYKLEQLNPRGPVNYLPATQPADNCLARIIKLP